MSHAKGRCTSKGAYGTGLYIYIYWNWPLQTIQVWGTGSLHVVFQSAPEPLCCLLLECDVSSELVVMSHVVDRSMARILPQNRAIGLFKFNIVLLQLSILTSVMKTWTGWQGQMIEAGPAAALFRFIYLLLLLSSLWLKASKIWADNLSYSCRYPQSPSHMRTEHDQHLDLGRMLTLCHGALNSQLCTSYWNDFSILQSGKTPSRSAAQIVMRCCKILQDVVSMRQVWARSTLPIIIQFILI